MNIVHTSEDARIVRKFRVFVDYQHLVKLISYFYYADYQIFQDKSNIFIKKEETSQFFKPVRFLMLQNNLN